LIRGDVPLKSATARSFEEREPPKKPFSKGLAEYEPLTSLLELDGQALVQIEENYREYSPDVCPDQGFFLLLVEEQNEALVEVGAGLGADVVGWSAYRPCRVTEG
jgi:hypothetical protein